jgi:hypothetical protein
LSGRARQGRGFRSHLKAILLAAPTAVSQVRKRWVRFSADIC